MTTQHSEAAYASSMAMHAIFAALTHQLEFARAATAEARDAMECDERNLAIGTVLPLERILPECVTLLRGVLALHDWRNQLPQQEVGAA